MITRKIIAVIKINRPVNFLITFFSIYVAGIICSPNELPVLSALFASLSGALIGAAGNIVNDIFDIEIDKINRPERTLPKKELTVNQAWLLYFLFSAGGIILSLVVNNVVLFIAAISAGVIFLYSWRIKKIPLAGNILVSFMTALAFIYGGAAVGNIRDAFIPAGFAFLVNLIRELVKDMEDVDGDRSNGVITFPIKYGFTNAIRLIIAVTVLLLLFTLVPFIWEIYNIEYFIIVMVPVNVLFVYLIKSIKQNTQKENLSKLSKLLKLNMIIGLIAIYVGIR